MADNNKWLKRKAGFSRVCLFISGVFLLIVPLFSALSAEHACPGGDYPPPPVLKADLPKLTAALEQVTDIQGRPVWKSTPEAQADLREIFESVPQKTKLEQFFQMLYLLQKTIDPNLLPLEVRPPGITEALLAAKVFTNPDFPQKIRAVRVTRPSGKALPRFQVTLANPEERFPINYGKGFVTWDQGMCQIAKELVFYDGFSLSITKAKGSKNLIVNDFDKVQLFGEFGSRGVFKIDLNYVNLERVEFIRGTDQGKVKARVAPREFQENAHSSLFRFVGGLIPNTSRQRIDW